MEDTLPPTVGLPSLPVTGPEDIPVMTPSWPEPDLQPLSFRWGEHTGQAVFDAVNSIYDEVVHWKPNLFLVPFGTAGTTLCRRLPVYFKRLLMDLVWNALA